MWNPENFGWPEYTIIFLLAFRFIVHGASHGKPIEEMKYSIFRATFFISIFGGAMYFGGFFA